MVLVAATATAQLSLVADPLPGRAVSGDHAAEGVPDDDEGPIAEVVVDVGEYLVGHIDRALRGRGRPGSFDPRQVEEH